MVGVDLEGLGYILSLAVVWRTMVAASRAWSWKAWVSSLGPLGSVIWAQVFRAWALQAQASRLKSGSRLEPRADILLFGGPWWGLTSRAWGTFSCLGLFGGPWRGLKSFVFEGLDFQSRASGLRLVDPSPWGLDSPGSSLQA